jgi:hypothetical protein
MEMDQGDETTYVMEAATQREARVDTTLRSLDVLSVFFYRCDFRGGLIMARTKAPPYQTPPVQHLLSVMHTLSTIPQNQKVAAMRSTVDHYRTMHQTLGLPVPSWIDLLDYATSLEESHPSKHEWQMLIPERLPGT